MQCSVTIGPTNDRYEREADQVAGNISAGQSHPTEKISRLPESEDHKTSRSGESEKSAANEAVQRATQGEVEEEHVPIAGPAAGQLRHAKPLVQRTCAECESEKRESATSHASAQRKEEDSKAQSAVQMSGNAASSPAAMQSVAARAISSKGPGSPLPPSIRSTMESRMGANFSSVRVHSDSPAQNAAASLQARAFTNRSDIWLGRGQSPTDVPLMAHELTHVVQQGAAPARGRSFAGVQRASEERKESQVQRAGTSEAKEEKAVQRSTIGDRREPIPIQRASSEGNKEGSKVQRAPNVSGGRVQRSFVGDWLASAGSKIREVGGQLLDEAGKVIEMGEELAWRVLERYAPSVAKILRDISAAGGIFNYIKNKVFDVARSIFGGLGGDKGFLKDLFDGFGKLHESGAKIIEALKHGDCQPLFDAFHRLSDMAGELAGRAWDRIKDFFKPIGDFFTGIWDKYISKAMDKISDLAGEAWQGIKNFFQSLWDYTEPVRSAIGSAWNWLKKKIGIGSGPEGENKDGILQWAGRKIGEAWDWVKKHLEPVTTPMMAFVAKINAIIPLEKILHFRDTVHGWAGSLKKMMTNLQKKEDVVENQDVLRKEILPAIKMRIGQLKGKVLETGAWVVGEVAGAAERASSFLSGLRANSVLSLVSGAFDWIDSKVKDLAAWASTKVQGLFGFLGRGLDRLSAFVEPVYDTLEKAVSILGNIVGKLPDLVLGRFWNAIPQCIRDPIRDWIVENVLSQIPILSALLKVKDFWVKVKAFAIDLLKTLFVKGDLSGAAFKVARFVLELAGVDVELMLRVVAKAADRLDEIIMDPLKFLQNLGAAFWLGLQKFKANIEVHLTNGLIGWLVGPLNKLGITGLKDLSLGSIFGLVLQVLGISEGKIRSKLEKAVGPTAFKILDHAWRLLKALWDGGPAALWEEIKSQLSELKSIVIGGITQWITKEVIEAGIGYLIKLSNPVGAIIQVLQAIYKVVKTIVEKANQILQVVDAALDSIGNIMSGVIDGAATHIEKALGNAVPVAITFVANLLGIGDPSPTISKIIKDVQEKVDKAMDWLIQKFKDLAAKAFGFVKGVVGKVAGLIFPKKTFTVGAEQHTIEVEESGGEFPITIHSTQMSVPELISKAKEKKLDEVEVALLQNEYDAYLKVKVEKLDLENKNERDDPEKKKKVEEQGKEKLNKYDKVAAEIVKALQKLGALSGPICKSTITYDPAKKNLGGNRMVAHPLSIDVFGSGTDTRPDVPSIMVEQWEGDNSRKEKYRRGHLLNQDLGGPGGDARNITPITASANALHYHHAEQFVKKLVLKATLVHYEVRVNYPASPRAVPPGASPTEGMFATGLFAEWYALKVPEGKGCGSLEKDDTKPGAGSAAIDNAIP